MPTSLLPDSRLFFSSSLNQVCVYLTTQRIRDQDVGKQDATVPVRASVPPGSEPKNILAPRGRRPN